MNHCTTQSLRRIVPALVIAFVLMSVLAASAFGQDDLETPEGTTVMQTTIPTGSVTVDPDEPAPAEPNDEPNNESGADAVEGAGDEDQALTADKSSALQRTVAALLIFGLLALLILFVYTHSIQAKFYEAVQSLSNIGQPVKVTMTAPFTGPRPAMDAGGGAPPAPTMKVTIDGPGVVHVSKKSDLYNVTLDPDEPAMAVAWTVSPASAATVQPFGKRGATVIAATEGAFTLTATADNGAKAELQIAAVRPSKQGTELPFVGQGYGTIAIAIILTTAVMLLGIVGTIGGEAVATLLGTLLGYIFGAKAAASSGASNGDDS